MALEKAKSMTEMQEGKLVSFTKKGDSLKAYYLGTTFGTVKGRANTAIRKFQNESGVHTILGQADIGGQIKKNAIDDGTWMEITFTGTKRRTPSGNEVKVYDISFDREDKLSLEAVEASDDSYAEDYEDEVQEEAPPARPVAPRVAATPPSADRQAKLKEIMSKNKSA